MQDVAQLADDLFRVLSEKHLRLATAESCTGGTVAAAMTDIPGSSAVFERGFVTYSNEAKAGMLGVDPILIDTKGAVSESVALAMARGALAHSAADIVVSITGIAGPNGGSADKPVGLVHFAAARRGGGMRHERVVFPDTGRAGIRRSAAAHALAMLLEMAKEDQAAP
ncbi:MAG: CinA family protein [Flavobacteriaceae bacterium]